MKKTVNIIFPHQLFSDSPLIDNQHDVFLVEEYLFFNQYKFHKQKLAFHRASMKCYEALLKSKGLNVTYVSAQDKISDIRLLIRDLIGKGIEIINIIDPTDFWLEKRIARVSVGVEVKIFDSPLFLNTREDLSSFFREDKKSFFQTTFYKQQRKRRNILIDKNGEPQGGKWTYDIDNRKKYPKGKMPPSIAFPNPSAYWDEALAYIEKYFSNNLGTITSHRIYPVNHVEASDWLDQFLVHRFHEFGFYEDAIVEGQSFLNHSILSPLINIGLLSPQEVISRALHYAEKENIPINSVEGFVRQIIGWREFIRGMYECKGRFSRTKNFWGFHRKIPASFYEGTTGIGPVDETIKRVIKTGYCHHIERLMVLGNFMLLCEFDPDEVYRWFMEFFIDAYDWVMVPNVYGMSQFADGGTFATKPYIGGSNYIKKMSNHAKGDWQPIWDGLFWRFVDKHQAFFTSNPRMSMMVHLLNKMDSEKRIQHLKNAEAFLDNLA